MNLFPLLPWPCCSVAKLCLTLCDLMGLQQARLPCLSLSPRISSNSRPLSWWCYLIISYSVVPFFFCLWFFPASGSFPMSRLFPSGGQSIGASASASVPPMNIQDCLLKDGLIGTSCSPRDSEESSPTPKFKSINSSVFSFLYSPTLTSTHDYWKTMALTRRAFVDKVMSLLFNKLSRLVIIFLPRSKHLLISWLQSPSALILEPKKIKSLTVSIVSPSICHEVVGLWYGHNSCSRGSPCPCTLCAASVPARQAAVPPSRSTLTGSELPQAGKKKNLASMCAGSFQSCSTLCNPIDCGLWGFSIR